MQQISPIRRIRHEGQTETPLLQKLFPEEQCADRQPHRQIRSADDTNPIGDRFRFNGISANNRVDVQGRHGDVIQGEECDGCKEHPPFDPSSHPQYRLVPVEK